LQLLQEKAWLDSQNVSVIVVTFEQEWRAKRYIDEIKLEWPLCIDHDRALYQAYGMERGSRKKVLGVGNWWHYIKLILHGRRVQRPTGDIYQLGGDVIVDPQSMVRFHFVSETPVDRPSLDQIKSAIS
jgi:alkyl hydroperoxide reductase subunit AhpC